MRKYIFIAVIAMFAWMISSCCKDNHSGNNTYAVNGSVHTNGVIEHIIAADKQATYQKGDEKYRYYETVVVLSNYLDADTTFEYQSVKDVMQTKVGDHVSGFTTTVYEYEHNLAEHKDTTIVHEDAFWLEDCDLSSYGDQLITFDEAVELALKSNFKKPHSAYIVLRKPVWKVWTNPLYIFGNDHTGLIVVDALTGEVFDKFPDSEK